MSERTYKIWSECWRAPEEWLRSVEKAVQGNGCVVLRSGIYDRWDLEVRAGAPGVARIRAAFEEHGAGKQAVKFRCWPKLSAPWVVIALLFAALATGAALDGTWAASGILGPVAALLSLRTFQVCGRAVAACLLVLEELGSLQD